MSSPQADIDDYDQINQQVVELNTDKTHKQSYFTTINRLQTTSNTALVHYKYCINKLVKMLVVTCNGTKTFEV